MRACVAAEDGGGGVVEQEERGEVRAGGGVFDGGDAVAEVEAFGLDWSTVCGELRRGEQAGDAAADVGGAGEVGVGGWGLVGLGSAQGEDAGEGGDEAQNFGRIFGGEGDVVLEVEGRRHQGRL